MELQWAELFSVQKRQAPPAGARMGNPMTLVKPKIGRTIDRGFFERPIRRFPCGNYIRSLKDVADMEAQLQVASEKGQ